MTRPIFDIRLGRLWRVGILGMALSVTGWSQTPYKSPERAGKAFWILTAGTYAAGVADSRTTMTNQKELGLHEINPILGRHPSNVRMYSTVAAFDSGCVLWSRHLLRRGSKKWYWPMVGCIAVNVGGTINNLRQR